MPFLPLNYGNRLHKKREVLSVELKSQEEAGQVSIAMLKECVLPLVLMFVPCINREQINPRCVG